jgi:hypothetical protein
MRLRHTAALVRVVGSLLVHIFVFAFSAQPGAKRYGELTARSSLAASCARAASVTIGSRIAHSVDASRGDEDRPPGPDAFPAGIALAVRPRVQSAGSIDSRPQRCPEQHPRACADATPVARGPPQRRGPRARVS